MTLRLGRDVTFPDDAVTQSFAILAVRGAGKSSTAVALAEEMYKAGLPWVAIDPVGAWFGVRSSRDGKRPGLPIPVFGGLHGDRPLEPDAGPLMADLVVDLNLTCVLDVSEFASKNDQIKFLTAFGDRLFRRQGRNPDPRHVFLEEADEVMPQRVPARMAHCVGIYTKLIKQGRSRGIGITIISQRSAVVNKDGLTQVGTLIALRTTSPQDRKAILGWIDYHAVSKELVESLPSLADGEGWLLSPHWLGRVDRVQFRPRGTFDSGATPRMGAKRKVATLADVDLDALSAQMAEVVERAEANDPKVLRRRISELERQLAQRPAEQVEVVREVPVPYVPDIVGKAADAADSLAASLTHEAWRLSTFANACRNIEADVPPVHVEAVPRPVAPPPVRSNGSGDGSLGKAARAVLTVLVQFPDGRTRRQLALQTGYSAKASTIRVALGELRSHGYVTKGEPIRPTPEGIAAAPPAEPLPTGPALLAHWNGQIGPADRAVLSALIAAYPRALTNEDIADVTTYSAEASTIRVALSKLRTLGLVDGRAVSDEFMAAIT